MKMKRFVKYLKQQALTYFFKFATSLVITSELFHHASLTKTY